MNPAMKLQIIDKMLYGMRQGITEEQYTRLKAGLLSMPDHVFEQLLAEIARNANQTKLSPKKYVDLTRRMIDISGITPENSALNRFSAEFMSDEASEELWADICCTRPSDTVFLTRKEDEAICELWRRGCAQSANIVPSDLFFAGKIPLMDCEITVDETGEPNGTICGYRVVVFPDYQDRLQQAESMPATVGALVFQHHDFIFFLPINICEGVDAIMTGPYGCRNVPEDLKARCKEAWSQMIPAQMMHACLSTWYGIQIALLHPTVREVFRHPRQEAVREPKQRRRNRKRVVRYIRHHVLNAEEIRAATYGEGREYERHTLVWYVIGHWRNYSNGKRVFIRPYWKGVLRQLKMELDGREREIVI